MEAESQTKLDHSSLADMGIKILVDAMTEAETNSTKTTSTPLRKEDLPVENSSILAETDTSLDDNSVGYNADTSNAMADCTTFESPAKVGCNYLNATPLTPTANLKMLVAAASSALDRENLEKAGEVLQQNSDKDDCQSRKTKSLAILCKKFLQVANDEIGAGKEFSLEMMSTSLGINRRRIYDIINVLEALEMISKQSKNWYMWHGQCNLVTTLAKLKAMAIDDPDIQPFLNFDTVDSNKENSKPSGNIKTSSQVNHMEEDFDDEDGDIPSAKSVRYDKSLGVLCQKFVMLFLISDCTEITLEEAGKVLIPDYKDDSIYMALNPPVNPKTKVRRLYDIANILSSLGLIKKKVFVGPHHVKKPGYAWSGPGLQDIESIDVARKNEYTLNRGLLRKSTSSRPYLHQYEVQNTPHSSSGGSAPNSPIVNNINTAKFKRSLSFSGNNNRPISKQSTVVVRPLCPKQIDYLREMKEFEMEMKKHSHRYPHVASIFHEFLLKYQSTMEQTASANGRFILPKSIESLPPTSMAASCEVAMKLSQSSPTVQQNGASLNYFEMVDGYNHYRGGPSNDVQPVMTACRYQSFPASNAEMFGMATDHEIQRESCALREKQNVLERISASNVPLPTTAHQMTPDEAATQFGTHVPTCIPSTCVSSSSIVTSNLVTNLTNSIIVNVLQQQNMLHDSTGSYINIDELLFKSPPIVADGLSQQQPVSALCSKLGTLVSQRPIPAPLEIKSDSTILFNPSNLLASRNCSQGIPLINPKGCDDGGNPVDEEGSMSPCKRARLE